MFVFIDLQRVLSIEFRHVAAEDVGRPDDGEILGRHPGPLAQLRHPVEVAHQPVHCPAATLEIQEASLMLGYWALL